MGEALLAQGNGVKTGSFLGVSIGENRRTITIPGLIGAKTVSIYLSVGINEIISANSTGAHIVSMLIREGVLSNVTCAAGKNTDKFITELSKYWSFDGTTGTLTNIASIASQGGSFRENANYEYIIW